MKEKIIYLAGGCFWGMEHLMSSIPGVTEAVTGYANGTGIEDADYETVCTGKTGFRETVQVKYDPDIVSLETILYAYFYVVDPTVKNKQGNDIGTQYQTGIYYTDNETKRIVEKIAENEAERYGTFFVEIKELSNFFPAEEYHQHYLDKNPGGYCHIPLKAMEFFKNNKIDPGRYEKPDGSKIKENLTDEEFYVTQQSGTERPFSSPLWNSFEKGIYVDIVTGEPVFSSLDKFESSCGWPAFSRPIEEPVIFRFMDRSHGMERIEVRSRIGNSHLGHVFYGEPGTPEGVRYCINGASLRFIPYEEMEKEGYGYLMDLFN